MRASSLPWWGEAMVIRRVDLGDAMAREVGAADQPAHAVGDQDHLLAPRSGSTDLINARFKLWHQFADTGVGRNQADTLATVWPAASRSRRSFHQTPRLQP
jgi:hypothetical protein